MTLFNLKRKNSPTTNLAGGNAFKQNPKMELASLLVTSFAQDQYYRSAKESFQTLIDLLGKVDPLFAAKAAVYARNEMGMRSITHVLAAELAKHASGNEWAKSFYKSIIRRPDDMMEILAYFYANNGKKIPNAMKKGFASAFDKFDSYQLAKYRGNRKAVKLVDLANLVHPTPTDKNRKALRDLVNDSLRSINTWESKLTQAGQKAVSDEAKAANKAEAWSDLITDGKLGYFALLRNLRNIAEQAPEMIDEVCKQLVNEKVIKRSLVMPFRFLSAQDVISKTTLSNKRALMDAINKALEISISNVPIFDGRTLIVLDDSGSMVWGDTKKSPILIGAIFAAMLYKSNDSDLMRFSDDASYITKYHGDSTMGIANDLIKNAKSAGTNFNAIFQEAKGKYDRIIILSDMQGWMGGGAPKEAFAKYKNRYHVDPYIYSFDLAGHGTLQFPENKVFALAGFSDKVFDIMQLLETDRTALIHKIEAIEL